MGPRNIHELLTSMQKDIDASLGIYGIDPNTTTTEELEEYIGHKFTNLTVIEYKKDIDLGKIQSDYFLTRRAEDGKVCLVTYSLISDDVLK
jgi:ribosomal protein S24E